MKAIDPTTFGTWWGLCAISIVLTLWWFRRPRQDATRAVACTTLAALPSMGLLAELLVRGDTRVNGYDLLSTKIALLWIVVGAPLLLAGFTLNAILQERPRGTLLVQLSHALLWLCASLMSVWIVMEGVLW